MSVHASPAVHPLSVAEGPPEGPPEDSQAGLARLFDAILVLQAEPDAHPLLQRWMLAERGKMWRVEETATAFVEAVVALGWDPYPQRAARETLATLLAGLEEQGALPAMLVVPHQVPLSQMPAAHKRLHVIVRAAERDLEWFEDGWRCYLCGHALVDVCSDEDMLYDESGGRYLNPASPKRMPSLEHVIPQALGGSNGRQNLRLACQPCNSRKGAR